jgi:hypothetical protein
MRDTIELAREAGIYKDCDWRYGMKAEGDSLKAFEAFVRADAIADERKQGQKWFEAVTAQHKQLILAEREALLDLVDDYAKNNTDLKAAIRARGNT